MAMVDNALLVDSGHCNAASTLAAATATTLSPPGSPSSAAHVPKRMDNKKMISSPQDFFIDLLKARGYPGTTFCSLKCGYHNSPTKHQTLSYGVSLTKAIRSSNISTARTLLDSGLHPNACNKFGESIVHAACRRGDFAMLRALIDAGSSVQVTDDFGRTPLHDACWTSSPNFDAIRLLLDQDPWLLSIMDCRGSTPLVYARKAHWAVWIGFLGAIADRYWPDLNTLQVSRGSSFGSDQEIEGGLRRSSDNMVPPLSFVEPNSRPLPDPKEKGLDLEVIELLANGTLAPHELSSKGGVVGVNLEEKNLADNGLGGGQTPSLSRITLDPLRTSGSNATTMVKGSETNAAASLMQGYIQVSATTAQQVLDCT